MPIDENAVFLPVRIALLTISDSRGLHEDRSGMTQGMNLPPAR